MTTADVLAMLSSAVIALAIWAVASKLGWPPLRVFNAFHDGVHWCFTPRQTREQRIAELERELGIDP